MFDAFLISGVFISTLIGAGFASGSEILHYFSAYSFSGFISLVCVISAFCILQYIILSKSSASDITYTQYLEIIMPKPLSKFTNIFSYCFMMIVFSAMVSGFSDMVFQLYGLKKIYGYFIMLFLSFLIISKGIDKFYKIQSVLCTFIISSMVIIMLYIIVFYEKDTVSVFSAVKNPVTSGISYLGYNMIILTSVLFLESKKLSNKTIKLSCIFTFIFLTITVIPMYYILCIYSGMITLGELPVFTIVMRYSKTLAYFYSSVVFTAMLSTCVSNCYVLNNKLNERLSPFFSVLIIFTVSFFLSSFNFTFIVNTLYRISGIISIYLIFAIIKNYIYSNKM